MNETVTIRSGRPVLAVLPFAVAREDDATSLIALGLHEDICSELTRFRSLQVISPASTVVVAGLPDDDVGARLGASHVLRGRLWQIGPRLQLKASLCAARTSSQLWSERFEFERDDLIAFEDTLVARIAATLNVKLEEATLDESRRRPIKSLAAHELTLRGMHLLRQGTREANDAALELFGQAVALDPLYARVHSGLSLCWFNQWSCNFWDRFEEASQKAYVHARRALELDDSDGMIHLVVAQVALFRGSGEQAAWYLDRALMLCPNDADLLMQAAILQVFLGRPETASRNIAHAMAINPYHSNDYFAIAAVAAVFSGDLTGGLAFWSRCDTFPMVDLPAFIAAAHAHLGQLDAGRAEFARFLAAFRKKIAFEKDFEPPAPLEWLFGLNPFQRPEDVAFLREGFRLLDQTHAPRTEDRRPEVPHAVLEAGSSGWTVDFAGQQVSLPELKGMQDIRRLLEVPGREIHCLDLAEREAVIPGGDAILDEKARSALKARLRDLQEDIAEAEDMNDVGRAERMRAEMDQILATLSAALGLGGRRRKLGDLSEKARTAVTWRIRHALRRIEVAHPALGRHLANSVRTGTFCAYRPEAPVHWRFQRA